MAREPQPPWKSRPLHHLSSVMLLLGGLHQLRFLPLVLGLQESLQSLGQTLELALVSAGVPLSLNVTQLGDFALAEKTTTTSTTTTTLYCPGEPVCGGIQGDCVVAPPGAKLENPVRVGYANFVIFRGTVCPMLREP